MIPRQRLVSAALLSALAVAASTAIVLVALDAATGARLKPGSDTSYDTEFIDWTVLQLSWLLAPLLGLAAYFSTRVALLGTAGAAVLQFWAMVEAVDRYDESGWADGLETLGFVFPIGVTVVSLALVLVGGVVGRRRRREPAQDQ